MKYNRLSFLSVLVALGMMPSMSDAAIRVGNVTRSNAQGYQQVNNQRYQQDVPEAQMAPVDLPINVTNQQLADQIKSGDTNASVTVDQLERCKMIYPNGTFEWARPTIGMGAGGAPTCTSVIELRVIGQGLNGGDLVVARANLAAGDSFECNISNFPEITWTTDAGNVEFPADKQPTPEDVKKVMDEEQKQNAALKIISGAVLGGLGGNVAGKNEVGHDGILGGGKDKITSTVIGAVGGAGLMAASTYSGKVAGDMILSTGVNAAAGAVMGNIIADGDSVMRIENCVVDNRETTCLWGYLKNTNDIPDEKIAYVSTTNINDFKICGQSTADTSCQNVSLTGGTVEGYEGLTKPSDKLPYMLEDVFKEGFDKAKNKYCIHDGKMQLETTVDCRETTRYVEIKEAYLVSDRVAAMVVDVEDSNFGYRSKDLSKVKQIYGSGTFVGRSGNGSATALPTDFAKMSSQELWEKFDVIYRDSSDGGMIDMSNKARLKGTLTGAGIGGAAGAFTAYQGAQSEIDERWVSAVRAYKDSLQKFYCGTGTRFMSFYNDIVVVPKESQ